MAQNLFGSVVANQMKENLKNTHIYKKHLDDIKLENDNLKNEINDHKEQTKRDLQLLQDNNNLDLEDFRQAMENKFTSFEERMMEKFDDKMDKVLKNMIDNYVTFDILEKNIKQISDCVEEYVLTNDNLNTPRPEKEARFNDIKNKLEAVENKLNDFVKNKSEDMPKNKDMPKIIMKNPIIKK